MKCPVVSEIPLLEGEILYSLALFFAGGSLVGVLHAFRDSGVLLLTISGLALAARFGESHPVRKGLRAKRIKRPTTRPGSPGRMRAAREKSHSRSPRRRRFRRHSCPRQC